MTITNTQVQACFDAWINCEDLLVSLAEIKHSISKKVSKIVDECALICMGTFHAMKTCSANINRFALLCVGICEECAEICELYDHKGFRHCADVCRNCSRSITPLVLPMYE